MLYRSLAVVLLLWQRDRNRMDSEKKVVQIPSFFMIMQGVTPLLLSQNSCATGNGRFWNIHRIHLIRVLTIYNLLAKVKEPPRGSRYNTRDELTRTLGRSILNINKDGRADGVRHLLNI